MRAVTRIIERDGMFYPQVRFGLWPLFWWWNGFARFSDAEFIGYCDVPEWGHTNKQKVEQFLKTMTFPEGDK